MSHHSYDQLMQLRQDPDIVRSCEPVYNPTNIQDKSVRTIVLPDKAFKSIRSQINRVLDKLVLDRIETVEAEY